MRQHPIPQNVLDVEFKLFTKFTLKEFTYLAMGVGTGGFFLYNTSTGAVPGIVGIPIFVILSAIGAFFALVPINDQPADKFIVNYFAAINKPTQRVWLNNELRNQRNKPIVEHVQEEDTEVVGISKTPDSKKSMFSEEPGDDIFQGKDTFETENEIPNNVIENQTNISSPIFQDSVITITDDNILKYQFNIQSVDKLPGNINIWVSDESNNPISGINVYLKDINGKILYANKTGPNGYFLTNKEYPEGIYDIEFENSNISKVRLIRTKNTSKLPLRIISK